MRHELRKAIKGLDGKDICEVEARDYLTGGDLLFARRKTNDTLEQTYLLVARVCGLDLKEVESMDVRDLNVLAGHAEGLINADPKA